MNRGEKMANVASVVGAHSDRWRHPQEPGQAS